MRLIDKDTGNELKPGDEVMLHREKMIISGLDPKRSRVLLLDLEADGSPLALPPAAIGAKFAA
jgi:hypothetical protein